MQMATSSCTTTASPETSQPDIMIGTTTTDVERARPELVSPGSGEATQHEEVAVSGEPGGEKGIAPGPKDPYCAFTKNWKLFIVLTVSMAGFFSPFAINIYIPALPQISGLLNISEGGWGNDVRGEFGF